MRGNKHLQKLAGGMLAHVETVSKTQKSPGDASLLCTLSSSLRGLLHLINSDRCTLETVDDWLDDVCALLPEGKRHDGGKVRSFVEYFKRAVEDDDTLKPICKMCARLKIQWLEHGEKFQKYSSTVCEFLADDDSQVLDQALIETFAPVLSSATKMTQALAPYAADFNAKVEKAAVKLAGLFTNATDEKTMKTLQEVMATAMLHYSESLQLGKAVDAIDGRLVQFEASGKMQTLEDALRAVDNDVSGTTILASTLVEQLRTAAESFDQLMGVGPTTNCISLAKSAIKKAVAHFADTDINSAICNDNCNAVLGSLREIAGIVAAEDCATPVLENQITAMQHATALHVLTQKLNEDVKVEEKRVAFDGSRMLGYQRKIDMLHVALGQISAEGEDSLSNFEDLQEIETDAKTAKAFCASIVQAEACRTMRAEMAGPKQLQNGIPDGYWLEGLKTADKKNWETLLAHGVNVFGMHLVVAGLQVGLDKMEKATFESGCLPKLK